MFILGRADRRSSSFHDASLARAFMITPPNGRRRDPEDQLQQLSAGALVAPPGVLGAKANDEGVDLGVDRWPAGAPSPFVRPLPPDELPVPAEESLGPDNERRPLASGHRLARRRQQEPVKTAQSGALHLALQHPHLVSKDQELDLPSLIWALPSSEDAANEEVDEREQHGSPFPSRRAHCYRRLRDPRIVDSEPFTPLQMIRDPNPSRRLARPTVNRYSADRLSMIGAEVQIPQSKQDARPRGPRWSRLHLLVEDLER
jgi:hypothetical protein